MKSFIFQTIYWLILGLGIWYLLENNLYPSIPNWTIPIIAVTLNIVFQGISYFAKLQDDLMESRIMNRLDKIEQRIEEGFKDTAQSFKDNEQSIKDSELGIKDEIRIELLPIKQNLRDLGLELKLKGAISETKPFEIVTKK
jgi:hypothetical protein